MRRGVCVLLLLLLLLCALIGSAHSLKHANADNDDGIVNASSLDDDTSTLEGSIEHSSDANETSDDAELQRQANADEDHTSDDQDEESTSNSSVSPTSAPPSFPTDFVVSANHDHYSFFSHESFDANDLDLKFAAKSESGVHFALCAEKSNQSIVNANCYDFFIDWSSRGESLIRYGLPNEQTRYYFNSNSPHQFYWLSLQDNRLTLGTGQQFGRHLIVSTTWQSLPSQRLYLAFGSHDTDISYSFAHGVDEIVQKKHAMETSNSPTVKPRTVFVVKGNEAHYDRFTTSAYDVEDLSFVFHVSATKDLHVALLKSDVHSPQRDPHCYEIVIGASKNTKTQIRLGNRGELLEETSTSNILAPNVISTFWITLSENVLSLGSGANVGANELISTKVPQLPGNPTQLFVGFASWSSPAILSYGLNEQDLKSLPTLSSLFPTTPAKSTLPTQKKQDRKKSGSVRGVSRLVEFKESIKRKQKKQQRPHRRNRHDKQLVPPKVLFAVPANHGRYVTFADYQLNARDFEFVFQARSSSVAYLALMRSKKHSRQSIDIVLDKSTSKIKIGNAVLAEADISQLVSTELRSFWISLHEKALILGSGSRIGDNILMSCSVPMSDSEYFYIGFAADDAPAQFVYGIAPSPASLSEAPQSIQPGKSFIVQPNQGFYRHFASVPLHADNFAFRFQARTAGAVYVSLLSSNSLQSQRDGNCYEIVIGGWQNSRSAIRLGNQGRSLVEVNSYRFNSQDHDQHYWIRYHDSILVVGRGDVVDVGVFMHVHAPTLAGNPRQLYIGFTALDEPVQYTYNLVYTVVTQPDPTILATDSSFALHIMPARQTFIVPGTNGIVTHFADYSVDSRGFEFVFHAQTKESVWVSFLTNQSVQMERDENGYEVGIGVSSTIGHQGRELFRLSTPNYNSQSIMRTYWIRLLNFELSVGRGGLVGEQQFMSAGVTTLRGNPDRLYIGFAGGSSPVAFVFGITETEAQYAHVRLPDHKHRRRRAPTSGPASSTKKPTASPTVAPPIISVIFEKRTWPAVPFTVPANQGLCTRFSHYTLPVDRFVFRVQVRSAGAAYISFLTTDAVQTAHDYNSYEVVLGGPRNKRSVIRMGGGASGVELTSTVANGATPLQYQFFWIAVLNGNMMVGQGATIYTNVLMQARLPNLDGNPKSLFVGFAGYDDPVDFIYDDMIDFNMVPTPAPSAKPVPSYPNQPYVPRHDWPVQERHRYHRHDEPCPYSTHASQGHAFPCPYSVLMVPDWWQALKPPAMPVMPQLPSYVPVTAQPSTVATDAGDSTRDVTIVINEGDSKETITIDADGNSIMKHTNGRHRHSNSAGGNVNYGQNTNQNGNRNYNQNGATSNQNGISNGGNSVNTNVNVAANSNGSGNSGSGGGTVINNYRSSSTNSQSTTNNNDSSNRSGGNSYSNSNTNNYGANNNLGSSGNNGNSNSNGNGGNVNGGNSVNNANSASGSTGPGGSSTNNNNSNGGPGANGSSGGSGSNGNSNTNSNGDSGSSSQSNGTSSSSSSSGSSSSGGKSNSGSTSPDSIAIGGIANRGGPVTVGQEANSNQNQTDSINGLRQQTQLADNTESSSTVTASDVRSVASDMFSNHWLFLTIMILAAMILGMCCCWCLVRYCDCCGVKEMTEKFLTINQTNQTIIMGGKHYESVQTHKETHLDIAFQCAANDGYYQMFADHTLSTEQFEFVFQAKGLDGAHVALLTHDEPQKSRDPNCYEIVIGEFGNSQSQIRHGCQGRVLTTVTTRQYLSATEWQTFWVKLENSTLYVGRGSEVGANQFMSARVEQLRFQSSEDLHVGFASRMTDMEYRYIGISDGVKKKKLFPDGMQPLGAAAPPPPPPPPPRSSIPPNVEPMVVEPVVSSYSTKLLDS